MEGCMSWDAEESGGLVKVSRRSSDAVGQMPVLSAISLGGGDSHKNLDQKQNPASHAQYRPRFEAQRDGNQGIEGYGYQPARYLGISAVMVPLRPRPPTSL